MQSTQVETWKAIAGYEGQYEVSDMGQVRSLDRHIVHSTGASHFKPGVILKTVDNGYYKYRAVSLGRGNRKLVHRLVAEAFIGDAEGFDIDHIDGDVSNNRVSNLRIVTHAENMKLQRERKPNCKRGHSYADAYWSPNGRRSCRTCLRAKDRRRRRAK